MKRGNEVAIIESENTISKKHDDGTYHRTSGLYAPIMALEGHQGEIYSVKFHPEGKYMASAGYDRQIFVWEVYGECQNIGTLSGHTGAILQLHFTTDGDYIITCSTDSTLGIWDLERGERIKKLKGHGSFVNSCHTSRRGPVKLCSGSDDCTVKMWDPRQKTPTLTFNNTYQVTAVSFNDTSDTIISAGIDNDIKIWDLRKNSLYTKLHGHVDTVTGLSVSEDGSYLLSNAMDNTLRVWDLRPFSPTDRCLKVFVGHQHNFEKNLLRCSWSPDGTKMSAGSGDRFLYIWEFSSRKLLYKLPGHNGSVNDIDFHPTEPIIVSGSSDKLIYLGELPK